MTFKPRLLPDSLAGRMALILVVGIVLLHVISLGTYDLDRVAVLGDAGLDRISERVASAVRICERAKPVHRASVTQDLSDPTIALSWGDAPAVREAGDSEESRDMTGDLRDWLSLRGDRVYVNSTPGGDTLVSVRLLDGSWINARGAPFTGDTGDLPTLVISTSVAAVGILMLTLVLVRWVTGPLRRLSDAADRLGVKLDSAPLAESGPAEVRRAAMAFNSMQERVRRFVSDRTLMFAAISHDLQTPITRLKLRAEFVEDEAERARMLHDLDDMEQMIVSLLDFLREEVAPEVSRPVDLIALLQTVCDNFSDAGHSVLLATVPQVCTLECRPNAIKRAISNLIDNAVKYGGATTVRLRQEKSLLVIEIEDKGPGIPEEAQEAIFAPFQRLQTSRSHRTGGTGLGLTVARTIARAHGGDVMLGNLVPRGLMMTLKLPGP